MRYSEFDEVKYSHFRKKLIKDKESEIQKNFLLITRNTSTFISHMINEIGITKGDEIQLYDGTLTENEFNELPFDIENSLFQSWKELTPAVACRSSFWAYVTFKHIEAGKLNSCYLSTNGGSFSKGKCKIDTVLAEGSNIDSVVRTILRNLGGLPEARGNRSVYINCSFARAWWRGYISESVCKETNCDPEKIKQVLNKNKSYWEVLINLTVSKNSVLGDERIRSALISSLADQIGVMDKAILFNTEKLKSLSRLIGTRQAIQELGILNVDDIKDMITTDLFPLVFP